MKGVRLISFGGGKNYPTTTTSKYRLRGVLPDGPSSSQGLRGGCHVKSSLALRWMRSQYIWNRDSHSPPVYHKIMTSRHFSSLDVCQRCACAYCCLFLHKWMLISSIANAKIIQYHNLHIFRIVKRSGLIFSCHFQLQFC